ncbi:substrate-binding domain-containing protein [Nocardioides litoris]|uniref:substrate-binding domain-containing protein n=1 Tax=Nocardioides litoris TaxID=1926648 RepID=UPI00111FF996|nr:substrate-binding domain-containing protein [Nocardioides litoris]
MFVRKSLAGAVTVAVTGSVLGLTSVGARAAYTPQPDDTPFTPVAADIIGAGSDTSQNALLRLATTYNGSVAAGQPRLATFAATGGGDIALPSGLKPRPNGSGQGKAALYGSGNNADIDFARSSSALSTNEKNAGLQAFPFALDTLKLVVSGSVASKAPTTITPAQMVQIYSGQVTNWSQLGGADAKIEPKIPQPGSGTRSFFEAQLTAANDNKPVTLAGSVGEFQENDPAAIADDPAVVAPFSAGRAALAGSALRVEGGFSADRALYNVVRGDDLGKPAIQALFGQDGFFCSDGANDEIRLAGFAQLDSVADGGVCGQASKEPAASLKTNSEALPIATTTRVSGTSSAPGAARVTARVSASATPTGFVQFSDARTGAELGAPAGVIGGVATLNLKRAPGAVVVKADYVPDPDSTFVASSGQGAAVVKAASGISESFPASVSKKKKSAKGVVTVALSGSAAKPTGSVVVKEGAKTVGSGKLAGGKATLTLQKSKVGKGKSTLTITWGGDGNGFGSSKKFTVTFKK